ncbi:G5 domain-containing protein [Erysipelothrix rhusiopathiae]|nr:G5 domain-containing protein [Erysipelothrix rhusiopathiae]MDE8036502.1 G5 domain-containing protein [Erysipelothrix rhusiopathiae]MDE8043787.1 G5 domain-containing protein [Erysipelothrix rhusiopathiae]MDE8054988.1 G5 domain-containing protein [Erysipelothrix rhusiopathiae]MDE8056678.1 G5 domain-containing protein [Erysipelothrix rhusiopathiae]
MKKRITLLLCIVLLTGCGAKTEPEEVLESKTLTTKDVELLKKHGLDVTESNEVKVDKDGNMIFTVDEKEVKVPFTLLDDKEADKKLTETLKEQKEVSKKDTDPKKNSKKDTKKDSKKESKTEDSKETKKEKKKESEKKQDKPSEKKEPTVTYREAKDYESIAFSEEYREDASMNKGESYLQRDGENGKKEIVYSVKVVDGVDTEWTVKSSSVIKNPVNKIIVNGTYEARGSISDGYATEVYNLINANRRAKGLSNLTWSNSLYNSAQIRAKEISVLFEHTRPNGQSVLAMANDINGENIVYGRIDMDFLVNLWMNSPGHYGNIMNDFKYTATAVYIEDGYAYAVQLFGY